MTPLFSVIVVVLNDCEALEQTLRSIVDQDFDEFEVVIKDGGSTDKTLSTARRFADGNSRIRVFSFSDDGIFDAMNQAVAHCRGHWCVFLNAGDEFADPDVLSIAAASIDEQPAKTFWYGDYRFGDTGQISHQTEVLSKWFLFRNLICHQTQFIARDLFDSVGPYSLRWRICSDREWLLRAARKGVIDSAHLDLVVVEYRGGGFSEQPENLKIKQQEHRAIEEMYFSPRSRLVFGFYRALTGYHIRLWLLRNIKGTWFKTFYRSVVGKVAR